MTRLSDDAWRARMEGKKTVREAAPLPLFDAAPAPEVKPIPASESTKGLAGMLAQHERDYAAALGVPASALDSAPPPSTAAQETPARHFSPRRPPREA